jgi:F-box and WD-40 domain protein MET30
MTPITPPANSNSYVCDTLPAPRLAPESSKPLPVHHHPEEEEEMPAPTIERSKEDSTPKPAASSVSFTQPTGRKLCVRHQRMADEGTNLKLQQVRAFFLSRFFDISLISIVT